MAFDTVDFHKHAVPTAFHESVEEMRELFVKTLEVAGANPVIDEAGNMLGTRTTDGFESGFRRI